MILPYPMPDCLSLFGVCLLLGAVVGPGAAPARDAGGPPNILFILADDLGARDLSDEGSTFYESPNIDRIARRGCASPRATPPARSAARRGPAS